MNRVESIADELSDTSNSSSSSMMIPLDLSTHHSPLLLPSQRGTLSLDRAAAARQNFTCSPKIPCNSSFASQYEVEREDNPVVDPNADSERMAFKNADAKTSRGLLLREQQLTTTSDMALDGHTALEHLRIIESFLRKVKGQSALDNLSDTDSLNGHDADDFFVQPTTKYQTYEEFIIDRM